MKFKEYWLAIPTREREAFALRCGAKPNYLNLVAHGQKTPGEGLCINIERESGGVVRCEEQRTDVDWAYLRQTVEYRPKRKADRTPA